MDCRLGLAGSRWLSLLADWGFLTMTEDEPFVDYYAVLQVKPDCSHRGLEAAYRQLAKMYHPDHPETADLDKFNAVIEAYRNLRNPDKRAEYDAVYAYRSDTAFEFVAEHPADAEDRSALSDSEAHTKILRELYKRRRENPQDAGIVRFYLQQMLGCSDDNFDFHVWYLKAKSLIETTENGTLAITIEGVDHVIALSRTAMAEKLRIEQSHD